LWREEGEERVRVRSIGKKEVLVTEYLDCHFIKKIKKVKTNMRREEGEGCGGKERRGEGCRILSMAILAKSFVDNVEKSERDFSTFATKISYFSRIFLAKPSHCGK
jgi:hypothetical protein